MLIGLIFIPFFLRMGMLGPAEETGFPLGTMFAVAT
jgi:hypothetical protein